METIIKLVRELLGNAKIERPPVPVEKIASLLKVQVKYSPLEGNISGLTYKHNGKTVIGINALHPEVRQRFTLAHELGHLLLNHKGDFFLDRVILFRDSHSSAGTNPPEIEANRFAAELLMPRDMLSRDLSTLLTEVDEDDIVSHLASEYEVSSQAMAFRLQNLGLTLWER